MYNQGIISDLSPGGLLGPINKYKFSEYENIVIYIDYLENYSKVMITASAPEVSPKITPQHKIIDFSLYNNSKNNISIEELIKKDVNDIILMAGELFLGSMGGFL